MYISKVYIAALAVSHAVPALAWSYAPPVDIGSDFSQRWDQNSMPGAIWKFQPLLAADPKLGCVSYPAIDYVNGGRISNGLKTTGADNGGCTWSDGQVYARGKWVKDGLYAIFYAWYFPKDQPAPGSGHRHDWEGVIVFTSGDTGSSWIKGLCAPRHGLQYEHMNCQTEKFALRGNNPMVVYRNDYAAGATHAIFPQDYSSSPFELRPIVTWDKIPQLGRDMLSQGDFGKAQMPLIDVGSRFDWAIGNAVSKSGL